MVVPEHVHDHGGDGGFAVAAADDDPLFLFALLVDVLRERPDFQSELLRPEELGVVGAGVHAEDHAVEFGGDPCRVPAGGFGEESVSRQPRP